jgi:NADPH-dependent glutamate synthase beta subunit-like oxidoreductase
MSVRPTFAIVGAGPSGFYSAEALLRAVPDCEVHIIERTATPHGLVRYGVAPDHQKLKQVTAVFDEIASGDRVFLHAGVDVGTDVTLPEIRAHCDAVVLATGSAVGRRVGVPGESLRQVFTSAAFVGWYNGHPDHAALAPDLAVSSAVIVGNGNVSLDVCRLLVRALDDLEVSDIPEPMLKEFRGRRIREVHMLGRGGPGGVKFTFKEFRQLVDLPNVRICMPQLGTLGDDEWARVGGPDTVRVVQWLKANAMAAAPSTDDDGRLIVNLWFNVVPAEFIGDDKVSAVIVRRSASHGRAQDEAAITIPCGIAVSCVGFSCKRLAGVPVYSDAGIIENDAGQVLGTDGRELPGLFVAGWAKRGPTGIIGTNRADADATVQSLLKRLPRLLDDSKSRSGDLRTLLKQRGIQTLTHADWRALDRVEKMRGEARGKPREKLLSIDEARAALRAPLAA